MNKTSLNNLAILFMVFSAFLFSMVPVMMKWGSAHEFPFLFIATSQLIKVIVISIVLYFFFSKFLYSAKDIIKSNMFKNPTRIHSFIFMFAFFDYALFGIATHFISYAAVSIIFQLSIILFVIYTSFIYRGSLRYNIDKTSTMLLMLLSFFGVAVVLYSHYGEFFGDNQKNLFYGAAIAFFAAIFVCFDAHCLMWSTRSKDDYISKNQKSLTSNIRYEFFANFNDIKKACFIELLFVNVLCAVGSLFTLLWGIAIGAATGEDIDKFIKYLMDGGWFIIMSFGTVVLLAGVLWRAANLLTTNLPINTISYFKPIITIICLWFLFGVDVENPVLMLIGVLIVIISNLLIHYNIAAKKQK